MSNKKFKKMSKQILSESDILELIFNNTDLLISETPPITGRRDRRVLICSFIGRGSRERPISVNECDYTSYARVAVARTSGAWDVLPPGRLKCRRGNVSGRNRRNKYCNSRRNYDRSATGERYVILWRPGDPLSRYPRE